MRLPYTDKKLIMITGQNDQGPLAAIRQKRKKTNV
jgi:hypothetical protein